MSDDAVGAGGPGAYGVGVSLSRCREVIQEVLTRPGYAFGDAEVLAYLREAHAVAAMVESVKLMFVAELEGRPEAVPGARAGRVAYTFLTEALRVSGPQANRDVAAAAAVASTRPELALMGQALADGEVSRDHLDVAVSTMRRIPKAIKRKLVDIPAGGDASAEADQPTRPDQLPDATDRVGPVTGAEVIDELLTDQARLLPPSTVERLGRQIVCRLDPERAQRFDAEAFEKRSASIGTDFAGMGLCRLVVDQATHVQLQALIAQWAAPRPAGQAVTESGDVVPVTDARTPGQRHADAMVDLMLAGGATTPLTESTPGSDESDPDDDTPTSHTPTSDTGVDADEAPSPAGSGATSTPTGGGAVFPAPPIVAVQATVVATLDQFAAAFGATDPAALRAGSAQLTLAGKVGDFAGATLHPQVLARLTCDSPIRRILLTPDGAVLHHGRARRLATAAQKRVLAARDGGCVIPGCPAPPDWCQAHHLTPWEQGGLTNVDAMVLLCSRHHTAHHAGIYDIALRDGLAWVRLPAWQDVSRPWLHNVAATHTRLADHLARQLAPHPDLPRHTGLPEQPHQAA